MTTAARSTHNGYVHGDEVQGLVDALARRLRRSVAVDDPALRLVAASRHFGDADPLRMRSLVDREPDRAAARYIFGHGIAEATEPVVIPAAPEQGLAKRKCFPIRWDNALLGFLWLFDDGTLSGDDIAEAERCVHQTAMVLYTRALHLERRSAHQANLARDLISANEPAVRRAAQDLYDEGLLLPDDQVCVAVLESEPADAGASAGADQVFRRLRGQLEDLRLGLPQHRCVCVPMGRRLVAVLARDTGVDTLAAELASAVVESGTASADVVAGVGAAAEPTRAAVSYHQARLSARAARLLPDLGPVASWPDLGIYGQLLQVVSEGSDDMALSPTVRRLLAEDRTGVLAPTAEAFLDEAGDTAVASARLHIHRSTLYYRLRRVQEITGLDLNSGTDRLTLHLGLKFAKLR